MQSRKLGRELIIKLKPTNYECTFSRGKAGGVHVKIQTGMAHPVMFGLKFGQILFFLGGGGAGLKTGIIFLGFIKLRPQ